MIAALLLAALLPQDPPPPQGIHVRDAGAGFQATTSIPNIRIPREAPPGPPTVGRVDTWMPLRVVLDNFGPDVEGTLVVREALPTGRQPRVEYRKRITLAERSRKRVTFPIQYQSAAPLELAFRKDGGGTLPLGGQSTFLIPTPRTVAATASLMLVATSNTGNFSHFLARTRSGKLSQERFVIPVSPSTLPDHAIAYDGVDAVALDDLPLRTLSDAQFQALRQFVARGGTLILSILRHMNGLEESPLADLLPGRVAEARNLERLAELDRATGIPCALERPQAMTVFRPLEGGLPWTDGTSTVVHRPFERGRVICLGFPLSSRFLERWPGAPRLMGIFLEFQKTGTLALPGGYTSGDLRRPMAMALKESMVRTIPPFRAVLLVMLAYGAAILLVPYAIFRRLKRLEWSWALVALFALGGSWTVYEIGLTYLREDSAAYRIGVIEGGSETGPHTRHNFWSLFTVSGNNLDLAFEDDAAIPFPLEGDPTLRGARSGTEMTVSYDGARLRGLRTYTQDSTLFETTDRQTLPARIRCESRPYAEGLLVTVHPDPDFTFRRGWIVRGPDIGEMSAAFEPESPVQVPNTTLEEVGTRLKQGGDLLLERTVVTLIAYARNRSRDTGRPVLLYTYEGAPSLKNSNLPERGIDFGLLDLPGAEPPPDYEPAWRLRRISDPNPEASGQAVSIRDRDVEYSMVLSDLPAGYRPSDIRFTGTNYFTLSIYDRRSKAWRRIRGTHQLPASDRYIYRSPLGPAYPRLLVHRRNTNYYTGYAPGNLDSIHAVSRLERTPDDLR